MEAIRIDPLVLWILRTALTLLFAAAALHKIRAPREFLRTLADYDLLPRALLGPAAFALIVTESTVAVGLVVVPGGAMGLAAVCLLLVYSAAIGVNLARGRREIDCGCLGPVFRQPLSPGLILRNGLLALCAVAASLPASERSLHPVDAVSFVGGLLTVVLLFHAIHVLASQTWLRSAREKAS